MCVGATDETRRILLSAEVLPGSCRLGFENTTVALVRKVAPNDSPFELQMFFATDSILEVWGIATACKNAVFADARMAELFELAAVGEKLAGLAVEGYEHYLHLHAVDGDEDSVYIVNEECELYVFAQAVRKLLKRARALQAKIQNHGGVTPRVFFCGDPVPEEYGAHQVQEAVTIPPFSGFCLFPVSSGLGPVTPK
jgi:hypothetical protein